MSEVPLYASKGLGGGAALVARHMGYSKVST
jgi:hypothetical protein